MAIFEIGETVICTITVKNADGTLTEPSTSMKIEVGLLPSVADVVSSTNMEKDSTGLYHYDFQSSGEAYGNYIITYTATDGTRITIQEDTLSLE